MKRYFSILTILMLLLTLIACTKKEEAKEEAAEVTTTFEAVGVVVSIDQAQGVIEINHQEIPGLMGAMTMNFAVKDTSLLSGIQPEDSVKFTISAGEGEYEIQQIQKIE